MQAARDRKEDRIPVAVRERRPATGVPAGVFPIRQVPSLFERQRIASLRERGLATGEMARRLGHTPSTVGREPRRNKAAH
ncbi:helix-turn-helix domain-containing protein [Streptomyces sp. RG80]|uniref:helix-turn-helix domain-containing protein n=1 Tax=Streptomyces sp. RG80 TaxID=3157340 RepID=UPI00338D72FA